MLAFYLSLNTTSLINSWCHGWSSNPGSAAGGGSCAGLDVRWVALLNGGEGWHACHHDDPLCAYHGKAARGFDLSYYSICALERLGLVHSVKHRHSKLDRDNIKEKDVIGERQGDTSGKEE